MLVRRLVPLVLLILPAGCSCDDPSADTLVYDGGKSAEAGMSDGASRDPCDESSDCPSGICTGNEQSPGVCCNSENNVCGSACCNDGQSCFAGECVTPGAVCRLERDCEEGTYCEYGLGSGQAQGDQCSQTTTGRCIALPPNCSTVTDGESCIADPGTCEYRPPVADLDAVVQWEWNDANATLPEKVDVWSTPMVGRVADTNCDEAIDANDIPSVVFVSGTVLSESNDRSSGYNCNRAEVESCTQGVLRVLAGDDGRELLTLENAGDGSTGFWANTLALADMNRDQQLDIVAITDERRVVVLQGDGQVLMRSEMLLPDHGQNGWGGGLAIADIDHDGFPEVAFSGVVHTTRGADGVPATMPHVWTVTPNHPGRSLDFFADVASPEGLELVTSQNVYDKEGQRLWNSDREAFGFPAVADLDNNGNPEIVIVAAGSVAVLNPENGNNVFAPSELGNSDGSGGPPTLADFNGDGFVEIGVAQKNSYFMIKPNLEAMTLSTIWAAPNHDLSSSVTGSTVFDFQGDGAAEVIYNDECFLWVYDGKTGAVRFAAPTKSFTATESNVVADIDADGHAEMLWIANQVRNHDNGSWDCEDEPPESWNGTDVPEWTAPSYEGFWRGLRVYRDRANSWVGTRQIWNQHAYSVTNICTGSDSACDDGSYAGQVPTRQKNNWEQSWANNFRQNIQETGVFDAADAIADVLIPCKGDSVTVTLRNRGRAILPKGVQIDLLDEDGIVADSVTTTQRVLPGRSLQIEVALETPPDRLQARIVNTGTFNECDTTNNETPLRAAQGCLR